MVAKKQNLFSDKVNPSINSQGIKANGFLFYVAVGKTPQNEYEKGIAAQAKRALDNIKTVLEGNGSSMDRICRIGIYIADLRNLLAFNEVYFTYFPNKNERPVRFCVEISKLAEQGSEVELDVIALCD